MTALQMIKSSLRLIGALATGESPEAAMSADALETLQTLLDAWSAEGLLIYAQTTESFSLTGATVYTIGSGGTINTTRPDQIVGAYVSSGGLDYPLDVKDARWYRDIAQKTLSGIPEAIFYSPEYPLGKIYISPVGSSGDTVYLSSLKPLTEPTALTTSLAFPPGYERALKYNLAVDLAPDYETEVSQSVARIAMDTLDVIRSKNASARAETVTLEILELNRKWSIDGG